MNRSHYSAVVSIPYRYYKNDSFLLGRYDSEKVSIPYRYYKNRDKLAF